MENLFLQAIGEIRSEIGKVLAARDYDFYRRNLNCESRDPGADPRRVNKTSYNFKPITTKTSNSSISMEEKKEGQKH